MLIGHAYVAPMDTIAPNRQAAVETGARLYQGNPCKRGHPGIRRTGSKACRDCSIADTFLRRALFDDDERERERARARAGKQSGRWAGEDPAKKAARAKRKRAEQKAERLAWEATPDGQLEVQRQAFAKLAVRFAAACHTAMGKAEDREWKASPEYQEARAERRAVANRMKSKRRKAIKRGAEIATATDAEIIAIGDAQGWRCAYCGDPENLHLDHKIAVTDGGQHVADNLQFLCGRHNMNKKARSDAEYREANGIPLLTPWDAHGAAIWFPTLFHLPPPRKVAESPMHRRAIDGKRYQGRPCKHGHDGIRFLSNGRCVGCDRDAKARMKAERQAAH